MLRAFALWFFLAGAALAEAIPAGFNDDGINSNRDDSRHYFDTLAADDLLRALSQVVSLQ